MTNNTETQPSTHAQPSSHPYRGLVEPSSLEDDRLRVPYRGQSRMRLALSSGLAHARVEVDPAAQDLIAIQCGGGSQPWLRVGTNEIALSWRGSFGDWFLGVLRPRTGDIVIVLHPAVEWTLAIRGGVAHCELDLSAGTVARVDVNGGCSDVRFELPSPATTVPIRIAGGVSELVVLRPADAGVALAVSGGIAALRLDDQQFDAIGGAARLETRTVVPGAPRYELQISGGASHLALERREHSL
jgi:hypothetical protein